MPRVGLRVGAPRRRAALSVATDGRGGGGIRERHARRQGLRARLVAEGSWVSGRRQAGGRCGSTRSGRGPGGCSGAPGVDGEGGRRLRRGARGGSWRMGQRGDAGWLFDCGGGGSPGRPSGPERSRRRQEPQTSGSVRCRNRGRQGWHRSWGEAGADAPGARPAGRSATPRFRSPVPLACLDRPASAGRQRSGSGRPRALGAVRLRHDDPDGCARRGRPPEAARQH